MFIIKILASLKHAIGFDQPEMLKMVAIPCGNILGYSIGNAE